MFVEDRSVLIQISELCHICCSRNCCSVLILASKLISDHISKISCRNGSWTDIDFEMSRLCKLHVKTSLLPYFLSSTSKKYFHFPRLESSRYFFDPNSLERFGK